MEKHKEDCIWFCVNGNICTHQRREFYIRRDGTTIDCPCEEHFERKEEVRKNELG